MKLASDNKQHYYNPNASDKLYTPVQHYYSPNKKNVNSCPTPIDLKESFLKSISNFTTKSSISLQLSTAPSFKLFGIPFGSSLGVEIKKEKVGNKINCYRIAEVEVGFIIGKKKYYETPIDCDTYQALSGTTYKEEVMVGPIVIIDDNQAYLDFNIEADINPFSLEVGIQQKH